MRRRRSGLTLIETLLVCSLVSLLISLSIPALQRVRAAADRLQCQSHLRQIGQALHLHHNDFGRFPPPPAWKASSPVNQLSWMVFLLPYLDHKALFDDAVRACDLANNPMQVPPHTGAITVVRLYTCPSDSRLQAAQTDEWGTTAAFTSYVVAGGGITREGRSYKGIMTGGSLELVLDGTSNTLCIGERPPPDSLQGGWWYPNLVYHPRGDRGPNGVLYFGPILPYVPFDPQCAPTYRVTGPGRTRNPCDRFHFWSVHGGGSHFLFVDGSVRFLAYSIDPHMPALISFNGGEPVTLPD